MNRMRRMAVVAGVLAAVAGLGLSLEAAVQRSPFGLYTLRTSTRSTLGQGGVDTAQVQFSTGTMSGSCLGNGGHPKGWAFANFSRPIFNRPRMQATNFSGTIQYLVGGVNRLGRARGALRVQRQPNGKFRLSGNFRSVVHGRGVETTSFTGWQTTSFPGI